MNSNRKYPMKRNQRLTVMALIIFLCSCSSNKIIFPTQLEYLTNSQQVLNEFIPYIQSHGYTVLNPIDTRMTTRSTSGFVTSEYLETDWLASGVYHDNSGKEYVVKQQVWILLDTGLITIKSLVGYVNEGEIVTIDSVPPNLHKFVTALPEGLRNLVSSKSL